MSIRSITFLLYAAILSIGGAAGGSAMTKQLAGSQASVSFLQFGVVVALTIFVALMVFYKKAERRVIYLVLFNITIFVNLVWFMSCLLLPIFWVKSINLGIKLGIILLAAYLFCANVIHGMRVFKIKWVKVERDLMRRYYNQKNRTLDWRGVMKSLKLVVLLYLPGAAGRLVPILYVVCVPSMLSGLVLRNVYPVYSVFAWGVPIIIVNSIFIQMIGFGISQISMLNDMEKKGGVQLIPL